MSYYRAKQLLVTANQSEQSVSPLQVAWTAAKWASPESIKCVIDFWDLLVKLMEDGQDYQCSGLRKNLQVQLEVYETCIPVGEQK